MLDIVLLHCPIGAVMENSSRPPHRRTIPPKYLGEPFTVLHIRAYNMYVLHTMLYRAVPSKRIVLLFMVVG